MFKIDPINFRPDFKPDAETLNVLDVKKIIKRMDFEAITFDETLFWKAFCLANSNLQKESNPLFYVKKMSEEEVKVQGKERIITQVKEGVEQARKQLYHAVLESKNTTLRAVHISDEAHSEERHENIHDQIFNRFIYPTLPMLASYLGANCFESKKIVHESDGTDPILIKELFIEWIEEDKPAFPIDPIEIPARENIEQKLYEMRQENTLCDTEIITQEGAIHAHSLVIFAFGGEIMQKMLSAGFTESEEKRIALKEFSANTVMGFVDFLYLGAERFCEKVLADYEVDFFELFQLSHLYQIQELIDCCTNLIALTSSVENLDTIEEYAKLYENKHLEELAAHYRSILDAIRV